MKLNKITTLMLAAFFMVSLAKAQTVVPNGDFELWQNVGSNTEEPTNWNSNKNGGGFASLGPQTCSRAGSAHGGDFCVKMESKPSGFGPSVNGNCTTGKIQAPTTTPTDGYIETVTSDANYNTPFVGRPDSLVGWYKYTSVSSDKGAVTVILHTSNGRSPETGSSWDYTSNIVAKAVFNTPTSSVSGWTRFSIPFDYATYNNSNNPQYFLCAMTSSAIQGGAVSGSTMWIDDLEVIYNPTLVTGTVTAGPYYVSASTGTAISVPYTATGTFAGANTFTAQLSNASGSFSSPTSIGSVTATTSGTISATIPAGTATGTGYRVRVVSSNPTLTAANNGTDIAINNVSNSIAPATTQNIAVNASGIALTATESAGSTSRAWKYSTVSGSGYGAFSPAETAASYTPLFATTGNKYMVLETTYPGGLVVRSNQVQVNVVGNSIAPTSSQSLLVGVNGTQLVVTASSASTSREWKYSTTSGSGYVSFSPTETAINYTPVFASAGTYYVVCQSVINGVTVTSNEVVVSVGSATIATGSVSPLSFEFSPSAPAGAVSVPFTTSGTFNGGNVFTAQLSDATGGFSNPTNIGTLTATGSGTISASIPNSTPEGYQYRIRVVSDNPAILGSDNGTDINVTQFNTVIYPNLAQSIALNVAGIAVDAVESQTAISREWKYAINSGGPYLSFSPVETGISYTPQFSAPGIYFVVVSSVNQYNDTVTSTEMEVTVANGTTLTTSSITGSPFYTSAKANVQVTVDWTTDIVFGGSNVMTAELSDASGSFANPTVIGTSPSASIVATIPNTAPAGSGYRIRVTSTTPASVGADNGTDLEIVPLEFSVAPNTNQNIYTDSLGTSIVISISHPSATVEWKKSTTSGLNYSSFSPAETSTTYTPVFDQPRTYYVIAQVISQYADTLTSPEVVVRTTNYVGINGVDVSQLVAYWQNDVLVVDLSQSILVNAAITVYDLQGRQVVNATDVTNGINRINTNLVKGLYILQIANEHVKIYKQ